MYIKPQSIKKTCFERYIGQIVYYWSKKGPHTNYKNKKLLATYNTSINLYFQCIFEVAKMFGKHFVTKGTYEFLLWVNCNKVFP